MATGQVTWYDDNIGRGRIEDSSGHYPCEAGDMEASARTQGAFVEFDIERDDPHDRAINVRLRGGTRNNPDQHRFGHNP